MARKRRANNESPSTILTRSGKAKLIANFALQLPNSNKPKTNTSHGGDSSSSMPSKKKAITGQRGKAKVGSISDSNKSPLAVAEKPKFKKTETPPKKLTKANVKTSTSDRGAASSSGVATRNSNRHGKEIIKLPLGVAQNPKFKKSKAPLKIMATHSGKKGKAKLESKLPFTDTSSDVAKKIANMEEPSSTKGNGKLESSARKIQSLNSRKIMGNVKIKGKAKEDDTTSSKQPKLNISEERPNVHISGVLTRSKAKMGSDPTPTTDPEPPKSMKAKGTTSTPSSARRGNAKISSVPVSLIDPEPPKSKKTKRTT
ncbi:hypothetical protein FXO38_05645 [Capsicum annuum]|uniref:Uncharacterized protein n=1 Tax=Capsicum annuum TaxID=4072 RepID=A0A2G2Y8X2_CAPAN|nr:hypothetical protein FXO37_13257 [Capsicum annuum]KAF3673380.1 hypothetical protein FXO38_05645 [Capsicum annuum]PHT66213.1 hypothetical protein T459_30638 [Capsicum annuum]